MTGHGREGRTQFAPWRFSLGPLALTENLLKLSNRFPESVLECFPLRPVDTSMWIYYSSAFNGAGIRNSFPLNDLL